MNKYLLFIFVLSCTSMMYSCQDTDLFDQNVYNSILKESFPVDSIDPNQDWKTVGSADVSVYVNLDYGATYTVKIYKSSPLEGGVDTLLASGNVVSGNTITMKMGYPLVQSWYFVTLVDKDGYMQVKPAEVKNGLLSARFGSAPSSEAKSSSLRKASSDIYIIPTITKPDVSGYLNGAVEVTSAVATGASSSENKKLLISGTWNSNINVMTWSETRSLYITGTWNLPSSLSIGSSSVIVVANGGTLNIPQYTSLQTTGNAKIFVMPGGKITGRGTLILGGSGNDFDYNGGTISSYYFYQRHYFCNIGTMNVIDISNDVNGGPFINWGRITVANNMVMQLSNLYNGCYIKVAYTFQSNNVVRLGTSAYLAANNMSLQNANIYLNNDAILSSVGSAYLENTYVTGPGSGDYALFQYWSLSRYWVDACVFANNLYVCTTYWSNNYYTWLNYSGNGNAAMYAYNRANVIYTQSECSDGYTKEDPTPVVDEPQGYVFCFEDNYPSPGDYDFNDVVMSVYPSTTNNVMKLKCTIDAVGAAKQSAGAIRLVGIKASDITSITKNGSTKEAGVGLNTTFIDKKYIDNISSERLVGGSDVNNDVVIPLFNDSHYAISGSMQRYFYNTVVGGETAIPDTVTYTITFKDAATASSVVANNLDAFIMYDYNSAYWEVHTFPYKYRQVLYNRSEGESSYYPWAVMIPKPFRYPKEWQPITVKITDTNTTDTGAYSTLNHTFAGWAADKSTNTDWYRYPVAGKVY